MRMRKLVLELSVAQILPEKINKMLLPKMLRFIDVLSTVYGLLNHLALKSSKIYKNAVYFTELLKV